MGLSLNVNAFLFWKERAELQSFSSASSPSSGGCAFDVDESACDSSGPNSQHRRKAQIWMRCILFSSISYCFLSTPFLFFVLYFFSLQPHCPLTSPGPLVAPIK